MEQLQDIENRLSTHRRETARLREELQGLGAAEENYQGERTAWHDLTTQRDGLVDKQCQRLTESSDRAIRARVQRFADASDFLKRLRDALTGAGVRGEKYERLAESITDAKDPKQHLETLLEQLELLAEHDADRDGLDQLPETPALGAVGLTTGDLQRIARRLTTDDWLSVSLTPIKSIPAFEFRSREGEYIPFNNASAGQQATALLKTLLNQPGSPLIIDQPEEDLDNPVVLEIVQQVWRAKAGRQLIFASHNANLVVNGDAELVAWCDYRTAGDQSGGKIAGEGAIDIPAVRDAIKSIMEGGEAAFSLRKEKYGF